MPGQTPPQPLRWSIAGGLALAVVYTISPLSVWVLALAVVCVRLSLGGLPLSERRVLAALLAVAIGVRVLAIALIFFRNIPHHHDQWLGVLTGDDAYGMARALRGRDLLLGVPANKYDAFVMNDM